MIIISWLPGYRKYAIFVSLRKLFKITPKKYISLEKSSKSEMNSIFATNATLSLVKLKAVAKHLSEPLRSLILSEPDHIDASEFAVKAGIWLRLLEMQKNIDSD